MAVWSFLKSGLNFNPTIPDAWDEYAFKVHYRGAVIQLRINHQQINYRLLEGEPLAIRINDQELCVMYQTQSIVWSEALNKRTTLHGVIFDLDGVITDTASYHYQSWKRIAVQEGIHFDALISERIKGLSRRECLNVIMERRNRDYSEQELETLTAQKNEDYVSLLHQLTPEDILPGIREVIQEFKQAGIQIALYSSSKNAEFILRRLRITDLFDVVITGNDVNRSKPDPQGMLMAAEQLGVDPSECVVIEDAFAGIEAASAAGMKRLGIGEKLNLHNADYVLKKTDHLSLERVRMLF